MSDNAVTGRPGHLWVVAILAIGWNGIACMDFVMTQQENAAYFESAGFTMEQMVFFTSFPFWAVLLWGIAVWSPICAVICLLAQKRLAVHLYGVGLITYVIAMIRQYGFTELTQLFEDISYPIFSVVIFILAVAQLLYARAMTRRGVLR